MADGSVGALTVSDVGLGTADAFENLWKKMCLKGLNKSSRIEGTAECAHKCLSLSACCVKAFDPSADLDVSVKKEMDDEWDDLPEGLRVCIHSFTCVSLYGGGVRKIFAFEDAPDPKSETGLTLLDALGCVSAVACDQQRLR